MAMQVGSVRSAAMRRALVTGLLAVTVLTVSGACGSDEDPGEAATASTQGVPSTTATSSPRPVATSAPATPDTAMAADEAAVRAAVDCYWQTIVEANDPPNPDHPGFDRCFTGPALERSRQLTEELLENGQRTSDPTVLTEQFRVRVSFTSEGVAEVNECVIDDGQLIDAFSGEVLNDATVSAEVGLQLNWIDGQWKVSDSVTTQRSEGRSLCAGD